MLPHGSFDNNIDVISLTLQRIVENNSAERTVDDLRGLDGTGNQKIYFAG